MEMENEGKQRQAAVTAVYDKLNAAVAEFELPPTVLQAEIQRELSNLAQNVRSEEDAEKFKAEIDTHKAEAEKNAKESLRKTFILRKIAKAEDIRLEEAEVNAQLQEISRQYGYPAKEFRAMLEKNGRMDQFQLELLNAKVLDKLAEAASK
jgi:trigger factor